MFDTEKFICEIEQRPTIWDVSSTTYSNKCEKTKAWEELCGVFIDGFTRAFLPLAKRGGLLPCHTGVSTASKTRRFVTLSHGRFYR